LEYKKDACIFSLSDHILAWFCSAGDDDGVGGL
jgi:hypothetical protein